MLRGRIGFIQLHLLFHNVLMCYVISSIFQKNSENVRSARKSPVYPKISFMAMHRVINWLTVATIKTYVLLPDKNRKWDTHCRPYGLPQGKKYRRKKRLLSTQRKCVLQKDLDHSLF